MYADEIEEEYSAPATSGPQAVPGPGEVIQEGLTVDDLPPIDYEDPEGLRRNTMFMRSHRFSQMSTADIMDLLTQNEHKPLGIEWIDDETVLAVYPSNEVAQLSAHELTEGAVAHDWATREDLFQLTKLDVHVDTDEMIIDDSVDPVMGRIGRLEDRKSRGACTRSRFYADQARRSAEEQKQRFGLTFRPSRPSRRDRLINRIEGLGGAVQGRNRRRERRRARSSAAKRTPLTADALNADLDAYTHDVPMGESEGRPALNAASLDDDLDSYLRG